jgi:hypothetical protein
MNSRWSAILMGAMTLFCVTRTEGRSARLVRAYQTPIRAGRYSSPTGKLVAVASYGEGEVTTVRVVKGRAKAIVLAKFVDATGFMWLPNRSAALVVSTCNIYSDQAGLYIWSSGRGSRRITPVKRTAPGWDECYWLRGSSPDGRALIYSHCKMRPSSSKRNRNAEWERQRKTLRRLKLP